MGPNSTVYDVRVQYNVEDRASKGIVTIGTNAEASAKKVDKLGDSLKYASVMIAGGMALHEGKKIFVDFNSEIEQAKTSIATISRMFGQSASFEAGMADAEGLFNRYQDAAKKSTATTKDFLDMHLSLAPTFSKFHAAQSDIEKIVKASTVVAPVLGERPETFAMDVKQMLQGSVTLRDRSAVSLLSMLGVDREEFNRRTKEDINYAIETVKKALSSPAISEGTAQMEHTFMGAWSTLVDTVQIESAAAGKEFFDTIKGELNSVNTWISTHGSEIKEFGKDFGTALVEGAHALKSAIGYAVEHKSEIMAIAVAWGASKLAGGLSGSIGGAISGARSSGSFEYLAANARMLSANAAGNGAGMLKTEMLVASFRGLPDAAQVAQRGLLGFSAATALGLGKIETGVLTVSGALSALPGPIGLAASAFTLLLPALHGIVKLGDSYAESVQKLDDSEAYYGAKVPEYWQKGVYERRRDERQKDYERTRDQDLGTDDEIKARLGGGYNLNNMLSSPSVRSLFAEKKSSVKPTSTNVTIHKIEVASDDPDRFAFGLVSSFERMVRNPTSARAALRGGY